MDGGSFFFFTNLNEWVKVIFSTNVASQLFHPNPIIHNWNKRDVEKTVAEVLLFGCRPQDSSFPTCLHISKVHINKGLYGNINEQYQPILTGCWWDSDHT